MARCTALSDSAAASGYVSSSDGWWQPIITVCRYKEMGNNDSVFFDRTFDQTEVAASCENSSQGLCVSGNEVDIQPENNNSSDQNDSLVYNTYDADNQSQSELPAGKLNGYWSFDFDLRLTNPDLISQAGKEWAVISRLENPNGPNSDITRYPALFFRASDNHAYIAHISCDCDDWSQQRTAFNYLTLVPGETYRFKVTMVNGWISYYINDQGWSYQPGQHICADGRDVVLSTYGGAYSDAYYPGADWAEITNASFVNFR